MLQDGIVLSHIDCFSFWYVLFVTLSRLRACLFLPLSVYFDYVFIYLSLSVYLDDVFVCLPISTWRWHCVGVVQAVRWRCWFNIWRDLLRVSAATAEDLPEPLLQTCHTRSGGPTVTSFQVRQSDHFRKRYRVILPFLCEIFHAIVQR